MELRETLKSQLSENGIFSITKPESKKLIEQKIKDSNYSDHVKEILGKHLSDYQDFISREVEKLSKAVSKDVRVPAKNSSMGDENAVIPQEPNFFDENFQEDFESLALEIPRTIKYSVQYQLDKSNKNFECEVDKIPGDGNCLFRTIAKEPKTKINTTISHSQLRNDMVLFLLKNVFQQDYHQLNVVVSIDC